MHYDPLILGAVTAVAVMSSSSFARTGSVSDQTHAPSKFHNPQEFQSKSSTRMGVVNTSVLVDSLMTQ